MAYPAGYSSDEDDDYNGFLSDGSAEMEYNAERFEIQQNVPQEITREQKLRNLFLTIMNGNLAEVIIALDEGIEVNADLRDGWTPLLLAASVGNSDITCELINRGADVNIDRDKYTALMAVCSCPESTASTSKCLDIVTQLIEKGVNVDAITKKRKTALMFAASTGNTEVVAKLLPRCNINAEDNKGWNALFWAANDNKPQVVEILLEAGINPDKIDVRGNTAVYYAISQEYEDVIKLLSPQVENMATALQETFYQFENLFEGGRPQFFRDICCMLYGMKCENLMNLFTKISLLDFLSLSDSELLALGVTIPYQRNRILTGLHKFHNRVYKQKSVSIVPKESIYSTIDISNSLTATVRQLTAMEADLKYVSSASISNEAKQLLQSHIKNIRVKLTTLKKTAIALNSLTKTWDASNQPVDLITSNSKKPKRWIKWFGYTSILLFTSIAACKVRQHY